MRRLLSGLVSFGIAIKANFIHVRWTLMRGWNGEWIRWKSIYASVKKDLSLCVLSMRLLCESPPSPAVSVPSLPFRRSLSSVPTFSECVKKHRSSQLEGSLLFHVTPKPPPPPLFFLYLLLISLHPLPCPLTNRLMWRTGMFRGWQFWQLRVERWAIKGFNWHSWVSHISLKWCENCESPAIIRMLRGGEKMDKGIEDRLGGNGTRNLERDVRKKGPIIGEKNVDGWKCVGKPLCVEFCFQLCHRWHMRNTLFFITLDVAKRTPICYWHLNRGRQHSSRPGWAINQISVYQLQYWPPLIIKTVCWSKTTVVLV